MMIAGNKDVIIVGKQCPFCGKEYMFEVPAEGYFKFMTGILVQSAFPTISATEREHFVSGLCTECQEKIFGAEEDE